MLSLGISIVLTVVRAALAPTKAAEATAATVGRDPPIYSTYSHSSHS